MEEERPHDAASKGADGEEALFYHTIRFDISALASVS